MSLIIIATASLEKQQPNCDRLDQTVRLVKYLKLIWANSKTE